MRAAIAPSRPWPDACISRPRSRTSRTPSARSSAPAATSAEYWPIEWPAAKAGVGAVEARRRPSARGCASRIAIDAASSAGWAFSVRSRRSAGPSQASALIGSPRAASAAAKTAAAAGEDAARIPAHAHRLRALAGEDEGDRCIVRRVAGGRRHAGTDSRARLHASCVAHYACGRVRRPPRRRVPLDAARAPARAIARRFEADLSAPVLAAGSRLQNVRQISERVAMGRALWRELVIGFASQLGELRLGLHPARGAVRPRRWQHADGRRAGRSRSAARRRRRAGSIDGLVRRRLVERQPRSRGPTPADAPPDPARPRRPARRGPRPGGSVPVRGPAAADRRAGDRGDGRGRAGDPCDQPARPPDPDAADGVGDRQARRHGGTAGSISRRSWSFRIQHRHSDGSWGTFEPEAAITTRPSTTRSAPGPKGTIYVCTTCDEKVVVEHRDRSAPD